MSDKLPQTSQNDEVDLGQLFNAIGKLFEKLFAFIGKIFKGIFSTVIYTIKPLVDNFKLLVIILVITSILGFILQKTKNQVYYSEMMVKPYFDSKYQLSNNINYFNSLISSRNLTELSDIFEIDTLKSKELVGFDLEAGLETPNDLFVEYDEYVKSIDTSLVDELSYLEYEKNRDFLSGSVFTVKAKSYKADIFQNLQIGFNKTFENEFSMQKKKVRDTLAYIERETLIKQLNRLDTIQKTYLEVIKNESTNGKISIGVDGFLPIQEKKTATKEYELFLKEQEIRRALNKLNQTIAEENTYVDVLSSFDKIGSKENSIKQRYSILFPILTIILFVLGFLVVKAFKFIKAYE